MVGAVGIISINFTKDALMKLEGEESINLSNEIRQAVVNDIKYRVLESKELAHQKTIIAEIKKSNSFFNSLPESELVIESRDNQWRNNFSEDLDFIEQVMNNPASDTLNEKIKFYSNESNFDIFAEIFITNSHGVNIAQTGKTTDYLQSDELWWQTAMKEDIHISQFNYDESSGVYSIDISQRITDESGNFIGVVKAVLNSEEIFYVLSEAKNASTEINSEIYVIDNKNDIIFTTSDNPFLSSELNNFENKKFGLIDNDSRFISISDSLFVDSKNDLELWIIVEHDPQEIFVNVESLVFVISIISLIVTISAIGIGLLISRSIGLPLHKLSLSSDKLAKGILDEGIQIDSNDELGDLGKKFEHMRLELKSKNEDLKNELKIRAKRLSDYKNAIDKHALVSITDKDGNIIYVNEKFCDVSKYNAEELIGNNHRILKSDYHTPEFYKGIWSVISKGGVWKGDIKNYAKDGSPYWVKSIIAPLYDDVGEIIEYIAIRTDITSQKMTEEKLSSALDEIHEHEKMKDEFSSMISHELKTPLTPIRGYVELLRTKLAGPVTDKQVEVLGRIENNVERLERLIGDVLDSQKLDLKKMVFSKKPFMLDNFMNKLTEDFTPVFKEKEIKLVCNCKTNLEMDSDEVRLRQVMDNLIRNAIDFVPKDTGVIEIGINTEKDIVTFYVKDNGIGISQENIDKLFTKFYQVDTSARRKHGGTGLGLVICKGIIEGLGGKIWISSTKGEGTTVFFSISKKDNPFKKALDTFVKTKI